MSTCACRPLCLVFVINGPRLRVRRLRRRLGLLHRRRRGSVARLEDAEYLVPLADRDPDVVGEGVLLVTLIRAERVVRLSLAGSVDPEKADGLARLIDEGEVRLLAAGSTRTNPGQFASA